MPLQRLKRSLAAIVLACLLASCAHSTPSASVAGFRPPQIPPELAAPCARPTRLGTAELGVDQVKAGWARDRAALARCGDDKAAIVSGIEQWSAAVTAAAERRTK
jgi:hypothetical protein